MLKKWLRNKKDSGSYFWLFLSVFTGIFFIMTAIILQVMTSGLYSSADTSLKQAKGDIDYYLAVSRKRTYLLESDNNLEIVTEEPIKPKKHDKLLNVDVIFYTDEGEMANPADSFSEFSNVTLDKSTIGEVTKGETKTYFGQLERYHAITVPVDNDEYADIKYATFFVSVSQLEEANNRSTVIIITVMIIFWFISIGASMYLSYQTRKPILESFEKQKAFVENASHELRTPLAVLQNRLELVFRKPETTILENSENIASSLEEIRNMRILTTNLLNLARRDDGIETKIVTIDRSFFDESFANYALIAEESGKTFIADNQLQHSVQSDKVLLKQLMTILFDNAVKYTGPDGIIHFFVSCTRDKHLVIKVSDNGYGISDDSKKKVFDRFYRVDKARTRQKGGFGLGLSLAKQIVDSLNGSITIKDNSPKGTIFEVKF